VPSYTSEGEKKKKKPTGSKRSPIHPEMARGGGGVASGRVCVVGLVGEKSGA